MVIGHHLLRDLEWRSRIDPVIELADACGVKICTASAYMELKEAS